MKSLLGMIATRFVPALLTAAGVVLITAGLISYVDPTVAGTVPAQAEVIETLAPSDVPTDAPTEAPTDAPVGPSASPAPSGSDEPGPSESASPDVSPSTGPDGSAPASILPDPTKKPGRAVATRVVVPALNIDLPVVKGNGGYPLCNVAMYLHSMSGGKDQFGQPGEGRATYLYAHARDGMFGPIYELAIQQRNAKKMLGMVVQVYTSDFKLYLYEIKEYRLHVTNLDGPLSATKEELWLQTSEGPKGTPGKTQLRAFLIDVSNADPQDAVPKANPVACG
jgi:hypothetical protein